MNPNKSHDQKETVRKTRKRKHWNYISKIK